MVGVAVALAVGNAEVGRGSGAQQPPAPTTGSEAPVQGAGSDASVAVLELMIDDLREELRGAREELRGAVVAFDREDGCPAGWSHYEAAAGRFIVGIGRHTGHDASGNELANLELREQGGERAHRLSVNEMPRHGHRLFVEPTRGDHVGLPWWVPPGEVAEVAAGTLPGHDPVGRFMYGHGQSFGNLRARILIEEEGGTEPVDNMPPYTALRFCRRD